MSFKSDHSPTLSPCISFSTVLGASFPFIATVTAAYLFSYERLSYVIGKSGGLAEITPIVPYDKKCGHLQDSVISRKIFIAIL